MFSFVMLIIWRDEEVFDDDTASIIFFGGDVCWDSFGGDFGVGVKDKLLCFTVVVGFGDNTFYNCIFKTKVSFYSFGVCGGDDVGIF